MTEQLNATPANVARRGVEEPRTVTLRRRDLIAAEKRGAPLTPATGAITVLDLDERTPRSRREARSRSRFGQLTQRASLPTLMGSRPTRLGKALVVLGGLAAGTAVVIPLVMSADAAEQAALELKANPSATAEFLRATPLASAGDPLAAINGVGPSGGPTLGAGVVATADATADVADRAQGSTGGTGTGSGSGSGSGPADDGTGGSTGAGGRTTSGQTGKGGGDANPAGSGPAAKSYDSTVQRRYYVDCNGGSDGNDGGSTGSAWQSVRAVSQRTLRAGDGIFLRSGCSWDGGLTINGSGSEDAPILVSVYGGSDRPWISNSGGGTYGVAVDVKGNDVVIDGVGARNATFGGVRFNTGTTRGVAQNMEITDVGMGVIMNGSHGLATHNDVHDLHMITNTPKNQNANDDYGAVGFVVNGTDNEVSWNRCTACQAPSYDYGSDGGFVEVWNSGDRLYVHHNLAVRTNGFFELGAEDSAHHANDVRVAYNVLDDTGVAVNVNRQNLYGISVTNFRFENNTSVQTKPGYATIIFPSVNPNDLIVRNNIFYMDGNGLIVHYGGGNFTHENNLYYFASGARATFSLNGSEKVASPQFANLGSGNFHLNGSSPAIGAGQDLGYSVDVDGKPVNTSRPSLGAYEG